MGIKRYLIVCLFVPYLTQLFSQNVSISGIVTDEQNIPVIGANIVLNKSELKTISNSAGEFFFPNLEIKPYSIEVTSMGYKTVYQEIRPDTLIVPIKIILTVSVQEIEEVMVQTGREVKKNRIESFSIQLVEEEFLKESKASTLMGTLNSIPGINSMDIGTGISKPMIRGMAYYRVVVAQNGIRQEGQQWSNHHGITVDQNAVNHVEIFKGPASLQYGSDAVGGVINILPAHVPLTSGLTGNISFTGKSNTGWLGSSGNITFRKRDIYFISTLTSNRYGDMGIPVTDSFLLPAPVSSVEASHPAPLGKKVFNTAGMENAVSLIAGIIKSWGKSYIDFNYYTSKNGFFDWEGLKDSDKYDRHALKSHDILMPYQKVDNYSVQHFTNRYFNRNKLEIALGYQQNISKEYNYLTDITGNRSEDLEYFKNQNNFDIGLKLHTTTGNLAFSLNSLEKQSIKFGIQTQFQNHTIDGFNHILPEYARVSLGSFVTHQYSISKKLIMNSGFRFDFHDFKMKETRNPDPIPQPYSDIVFNPLFYKIFTGTSFSFGINYLPNDQTIIKTNIGKSYRVPSAYELGAYGLHRHEGRFEKGDIQNNPEQAWQFDIGLEQQWKNFQYAISPFVSYFTNYLYLTPTPDFAPGQGQIYIYSQTKALLSGGEASIIYSPVKKLKMKAGAEYVYAVNLDKTIALPFTPPTSIQAELTYQIKNTKQFKNSRIGLETVFVAKQEYTVPNELSTPGYSTFNINASGDIKIGKQKIGVMLKARNVFNNKYYNHISFYRRLRIPEPGRDFQIFVEIPFLFRKD